MSQDTTKMNNSDIAWLIANTNQVPAISFASGGSDKGILRRVIVLAFREGTDTFAALLRAELQRVGSETRARTGARAAWDYLCDEAMGRERRLASTTAFRRRETLKAAGLTDIADPARLAAIACDLQITDEAGLVRLVRLLNRGGAGSLDRTAVQYLGLVTRAYHELVSHRREATEAAGDLTGDTGDA